MLESRQKAVCPGVCREGLLFWCGIAKIDKFRANFAYGLYLFLNIYILNVYFTDKGTHMDNQIVEINDKSSVVADTIHGQIVISSFEKDIIATTLFNRLHGIHQNSTAYMTFPTNRTKRMEHSFGTMYLCGKIFSSSVCNASPEDNEKFFDRAAAEIESIIREIKSNSEYNQKLGQIMKKAKDSYKSIRIGGGIYDRVLPGNIDSDSSKVFIIFFESVRIAGLLHDVGHPPFSHIAETALVNIYEKIEKENKDNERVQYFKQIIRPFYGKELHEQIGNRIAGALLKEAIPDITKEDVPNGVKYGGQVFRLIVAQLALKILKEESAFCADLHSIISGTLDGDRLDYVSRDPWNSGFNTGMIEYERMISNMKMVEKEEHFLFCPSASTVNTIEDFMMRRWNMYRNIIFHHHVVKTDYILQKSIEEIACEYLMNDSEEEESDSYNYILPYDISGLWKAVKEQASTLEWGYSISQWDDAWLMTVLKKVYFEKIEDGNTTLLNKMLAELLTNQRQFASLIKRKEEFYTIDRAFAEEVVRHEAEISVLIEQLEKSGNVSVEEDGEKKDGVEIEGFNTNVRILFEKARNYNEKTTLTDNDGFLLFYVRTILTTQPKVDSFQKIVTDVIAEYGQGHYLVVFKSPKTGMNKDLYLWKKWHEEDKDKQLEKLVGISDINIILNSNLQFLPFFFIYVDMNKVHQAEFDFQKERRNVGEIIACGVCDYLKEFFNNI